MLQIDVRAAFLNGPLQEELYVPKPEGFEKEGDEDKVLRLHKSLYGLRQVARAWNLKLCQIRGNIGFQKRDHEQSLFICQKDDGGRVLLLAYVNDIILTGDRMEKLQRISEEIGKYVE